MMMTATKSAESQLKKLPPRTDFQLGLFQKCNFFLCKWISDTIPTGLCYRQVAIQLLITWHHHPHFPTLSLEHLTLSLKLPMYLSLHSLLIKNYIYCNCNVTMQIKLQITALHTCI
jgi:hypothetical protein